VEGFRADYTTFRRDRHSHSGGVFICLKNYFTCAELRDDEIIAVEIKDRNPKITWEIVVIHRTPNEDIRLKFFY
jgi:hypothetical protein